MYLPVGITEEEHRDRMIAVQEELLELRRLEISQQHKSRFWKAVGSIATIGIPLVTFLGLHAAFKIGQK